MAAANFLQSLGLLIFALALDFPRFPQASKLTIYHQQDLVVFVIFLCVLSMQAWAAFPASSCIGVIICSAAAFISSA